MTDEELQKRIKARRQKRHEQKRKLMKKILEERNKDLYSQRNTRQGRNTNSEWNYSRTKNRKIYRYKTDDGIGTAKEVRKNTYEFSYKSKNGKFYNTKVSGITSENEAKNKLKIWVKNIENNLNYKSLNMKAKLGLKTSSKASKIATSGIKKGLNIGSQSLISSITKIGSSIGAGVSKAGTAVKASMGLGKVLMTFAGGPLIAIILLIVLIIVPLFFLSGSESFNSDEDEVTSSEEDTSASTGEVTIVGRDGLCWKAQDSFFCYPITNMTGTTATFGKKGKSWSLGYHTGLDFIGPKGKAQCVAVYDGVVYFTGSSGSYGNHVIIKHAVLSSSGVIPVFYTQYSHMSSINVTKGQTVKQGQVLGMLGDTGNVTGPHCHFEFSFDPKMFSTAKDPMYWLFEEHIAKDYGATLDKSSIPQLQKP